MDDEPSNKVFALPISCKEDMVTDAAFRLLIDGMSELTVSPYYAISVAVTKREGLNSDDAMNVVSICWYVMS